MPSNTKGLPMIGNKARIGALATIVALGMVLAGCSSSKSSKSPASAAASTPATANPSPAGSSTPAAAATSSAATSPASSAVASTAAASSAPASGVAQAAAAVAAAENAASGFTAPGGALANVASLKGKTVYYIPIALQVPFFQGAIQGLKDAYGPLGITVQTCDGGGSPSAISACLNQAVTAGAAAVITDSVSSDFAQNAFNNVTAHHIPLLFMNEPTATQNDTLASVGGDAGQTYTKLTADWIIADSKGTANVLVVEITDSQASKDFIEKGGLAEFASQCPGCKVTTVETTTPQLQTLPTLVSSTLVKDPAINYLFPEFDIDVAGAIQGLQTGGTSHNVTVASTTGVLASLQSVASKQHQLEDTGESEYGEAWNAADAVLRMILKQPVPADYSVPVRVFDANNIGSLTLTAAAANSGAWYGTGDFRAVYQKLWGSS
jgi:ribose transport system substrate-binding protein